MEEHSVSHLGVELSGEPHEVAQQLVGMLQVAGLPTGKTLETTAMFLGGHVRVGLEDSLMIARGKLAKSNAEQVAKIRRIVEERIEKVFFAQSSILLGEDRELLRLAERVAEGRSDVAAKRQRCESLAQ